MKKRAIVIVLDSVGVGALPDAAEFGDESCNTLGNVARYSGGLKMPTMESLGLGNIIDVAGLKNVGTNARGCWGKAGERSTWKDTNTGHYEIAGLVTHTPHRHYPDGFPKYMIEAFCEEHGFSGVLGNKVASGTMIIEELGAEHIKTGLPIIYTSADSAFQIAAHEDVISPKKLWEMCEKTLQLYKGTPDEIKRVIARPFITKGDREFWRTSNRRDYSFGPQKRTVLDYLKESGLPVYGIGKIEDIFNGQGLTRSVHTENNADGMKKTIEAVMSDEGGLIFTNLVDFDMRHGHRNDPRGYATALEEFDSLLPNLLKVMRDDDILLVTADHGCDPTYTESTDHSREYIPIIVYGKKLKSGIDLGVRESYADIGVSIADFFDLKTDLEGKSFLRFVSTNAYL